MLSLMTSSLRSTVVVAPPEAEQAIRNTIAQWEADAVASGFDDDESLEVQQALLQRHRKELLENITKMKLAIIEAEAAGVKTGEQPLKDLNGKLNELTSELETTFKFRLTCVTALISIVFQLGLGFEQFGFDRQYICRSDHPDFKLCFDHLLELLQQFHLTLPSVLPLIGRFCCCLGFGEFLRGCEQIGQRRVACHITLLDQLQSLS